MRFVLHLATLTLGLWILTKITPISYDRPEDLFWAAVVLVIFNAIVKPVLLFISIPFLLLTLGLFFFVINALILDWVPVFVHGFHVPGFGWAFVGSLILSLITSVFTGFERLSMKRRVVMRLARNRDRDVIDI